MTTKLNKPISRETEVQIFDRGNRNIIVTLQGDCIVFKLKGLRSQEVLPISQAYGVAVKNRLGRG